MRTLNHSVFKVHIAQRFTGLFSHSDENAMFTMATWTTQTCNTPIIHVPDILPFVAAESELSLRGKHENCGTQHQEKGDGAAVLAASIKAPDAREEDAKRESIVQATTEACAGGPAKEGLDMECEESATPAVGKRQLEVSEENGKPEASAGEPLPKAQFTRRPTLKIQPKVPPDRRATPPAAKKTTPADPP
ncbi:hypothetical protein HPB50_028579 [Hyalomma asiaticum]|nr:hypothetical protein HPB50_028579 [Hyalomma asiaticum]